VAKVATAAFRPLTSIAHNKAQLTQIFHTVPTAVGAPGVRALANLVVELQHGEGWTVRARMSKSPLMRSDDPVLLVTLENLTEWLWVDGDSAVGERVR
jgi:hypothetical protein